MSRKYEHYEKPSPRNDGKLNKFKCAGCGEMVAWLVENDLCVSCADGGDFR